MSTISFFSSLTGHRNNQNWITFNSYTVSFLREKREKCVIYKEKKGNKDDLETKEEEDEGDCELFRMGCLQLSGSAGTAAARLPRTLSFSLKL